MGVSVALSLQTQRPTGRRAVLNRPGCVGRVEQSDQLPRLGLLSPSFQTSSVRLVGRASAEGLSVEVEGKTQGGGNCIGLTPTMSPSFTGCQWHVPAFPDGHRR